jgi:hypothetical protein
MGTPGSENDMNARAEMHLDVMEPTTTLARVRGAPRAAAPAAGEQCSEPSPPPSAAPLDVTRAGHGVTPAHVPERREAEDATGTPSLPRLMDWAVVLALVGLFIFAGGM